MYRTGSCYKHSITAENSTARDSLYIKAGFRLQIRLMGTRFEGFDKEKKSGKQANRGRRKRVDCSINGAGKKECKSIRKYWFFESIGDGL